MEEDLKNIFNNVNEWLKFAELKNGTLLATLTAVLGILLDRTNKILFQGEQYDLNFWISIYLVSLMFFFTIAICILLISFLAQTRVIFKPTGEKSENDNIIFYGHIIKYKPEEYLRFIDTTKHDFSKQELDYANQIVVNSHITYRKYKYFNIALFLTLTGVLTLIGSLLIKIILNPNN